MRRRVMMEEKNTITVETWIFAVAKYYLAIHAVSVVNYIGIIVVGYLTNIIWLLPFISDNIGYTARVMISMFIGTVIALFCLWEISKAGGAKATVKRKFSKNIAIWGNVIAGALYCLTALPFINSSLSSLFGIAYFPMLLVNNNFWGVLIISPFIVIIKILGAFYGYNNVVLAQPTLNVEKKEEAPKPRSWKDSVK